MFRVILAIAGLMALCLGLTTSARAQSDQPGSPTVVSIVRTTPSPQIMRASSVVFTVTFSEAVTNVSTACFFITPVNGGTTTATVASVTGGPTVYQVTVNITGGAGDFRLDIGPTVTAFATGFRNSSSLAFDHAGNLYVADDDNQLVKKVTSGGVMSTFATGIGAPYGMAFDQADNLYVANNGEVKKVTSGGVVSTFATGFNVAGGMAFDSAGNLYVGNYGNSTVSKVTPGGVVSTFATGVNAPFGLTFDAAGNLYVGCRDASVIDKITPGGVVTTFASGLAGPEELQFDANGDLFVADRWADRVVRIKPDGTVSTYAANMPRPYGLAFDAAGALYITSYYSDNTVRKLTVPVIDDLGGNAVPGLPYTAGESYTYDPNDAPTDIQLSNTSLDQPGVNGAIVGTLSSTDADLADAHTYSLVSGAGDANNGLFAISGDSLRAGASIPVSGFYSVRIRSDDGQGGTCEKVFVISVGIPRIVSITRKTPSGPSTAASAVVFVVTYSAAVTGVAADGFALTPLNGASVTGSVASVSGGPTVYDVTVNLASGTGEFRLDAVVVPPVASTFSTGFNNPSALAFDGSGNLYVANFYGGTVNKVVSDGTASVFAGGFNGPSGLAFDSQGNLYVANNWSNTVSIVNSGGAVSTFASGFNSPYGLAFDAQGNLYVANTDDNSVSKVTSGGIVSTFANGFNGPTALAFSAAGDLYVANQWDNSVSKVASNGTASFFSDGFTGALGLAFDGADNLYVASNWNDTVNQVTPQVILSVLTSGISQPSALAFDGTGDLYVASQGDGSITRLAMPVSVKNLAGFELVGLPFTSGQSFTRVLNFSPTDILLSNGTVNQSAGTNATLGALTTTDADGGDSHAYTLVTGTGDTNNASFNLSGSTLRANNSATLPAGSYSVRVRTDDGISTPYEKAFTLTVVDDVAPAAPSTPDLAAASDTGSSNTDNITSVTTPIFTGTAEANSTIQLFRGGSTSLGTATVDGSGNWTLTVGSALSPGTYSITAKAKDAANNISAASAALSVTITGAAPSAPSTPDLSPASDSGSSNTDNITSITTPTFTGTAATGSTVELFRGGSISIGTTTVDGGGNWSITLASALADGVYSITVKATDVGGQTSAPSTALNLTIDTTASAAPVITAISNDTGISNTDHLTSDTTLVLGGTAAANETVTVFRNTAQIGTTTANGGGVWSFDYTGTALAGGTHTFTAKSTDLAGNVSGESAAFLVEIDVSTPAAPVITGISNDTGSSATDGITSDNTLILNGTAEAGATVTLSRSGVGVIGTTTANGSGAWSFDYGATPLPDGAYLFTAFASDAAGNNSTVSADFPVTIDTTAPVISLQPVGGAYVAGDSFTLTVGATDATTLAYQWYLGSTALDDYSNRTGATTASVTHTGIGLVGFNGNYTVRVTDLAGNTSTSAVATVVVNQADQTITFPSIADQLVTAAPFTISATANTGFVVTFSVVSGPATISGNTVTVTGAGMVIIRASQPGDLNHNSSFLDRSFNVTKATASVTLGGLNQMFDGFAHSGSASTTPGNLTVDLTYDGSSTPPINAGSYAVVATVNDVAYAGIASGTLVVAKANQAITFGALSDKALNAPAFTLTATATSSLPVTFSVVSGPGAISGNTVTLSGSPGVVTIAAHQAGDANHAAAPDVTRSFTVIGNNSVPAPDGFADSVTGGGSASPVTVTSATEFITQANSSAPAVITVVGTVNLGSGTVQVLSNKTIQGSDANTTLVGNLNIAGNVRNVVIRGLTLTNPGTTSTSGIRQEAMHAVSLADSITSQASISTDGGAAVTIAGAHDVFISHCSFFDCADYAVKITNGADAITISWSEFGNTLGQRNHRGSVLIGSAGAETTPLHVSMHHNLWSAGVDQGMPFATYAYVHLYNNYFNTPGNTGGTEALDQSQILSERNVYAGVANPLTRRQVNSALPLGRILALGNLYTATTGTPPDAGTDAVFTPSYSYEMLPVSDVAAVVSAHAGNDAGTNLAETATGSATLTGPTAAVARGANFTLTVTPGGVTPASYQWRRNNVDLPNATASSLSVTNTQEANAGTYTVALILNSEDVVVSSPVVVTLAADPVVVTPPPTTPAPSSSGGGGVSFWFIAGLTLLASVRFVKKCFLQERLSCPP